MARSASPPLVGYLLHGPRAIADLPACYDALGEHTPALEPDPPEGCWLDLRGGRRGPAPGRRGARILARAAEWGGPGIRLGVAPTPGTAKLAARLGPDPLTLRDREQIAAFLAPLPVAVTGVGPEIVDRLALLGLRTLGALAALPRGRLGDYLGSLGPALEALARAEDDRPLVPARPPLVLSARRDLDFALDDRAALDALIAYLLAPLLASLRRQGLGVTRVEVGLSRVGGATATMVQLRTPTADPGEVLRALLPALPTGSGNDDAPEAGDGVTAVLVTLTAPRPLTGVQASFFDVPQGRRGLLAQGVDEVRRRGDGAVGYFQPVEPAHPRRERRYALVEGAVPSEDRTAAT
jgi:hypothetical protein